MARPHGPRTPGLVLGRERPDQGGGRSQRFKVQHKASSTRFVAGGRGDTELTQETWKGDDEPCL